MDNHKDEQVEAFLIAISRDNDGFADVQEIGNGEFIIDGVVNVRAALDAAIAVVTEEMIERGAIALAGYDWESCIHDRPRWRDDARDVLIAANGSAITSSGTGGGEKLWCESCGEAEQSVHTEFAGLCAQCADEQGEQ